MKTVRDSNDNVLMKIANGWNDQPKPLMMMIDDDEILILVCSEIIEVRKPVVAIIPVMAKILSSLCVDDD